MKLVETLKHLFLFDCYGAARGYRGLSGAIRGNLGQLGAIQGNRGQIRDRKKFYPLQE